MQYSKDGIALTEHFEGCKLIAYLDQVGVPTIGYGHTKGVMLGMECTQTQAETWLIQDIADAESAVNTLVIVALTQNQFDALVDFVFNLGIGNFRSSTLLKLLNAGDYAGAAHQFERWCRAGGVVRSGLLARRQADDRLFEQTS